ncbi:MAG TPA: RNA-binding protein [Chthoniobacterales bacterium]|jgi:RNA recognition motif-containing protein|nr:RNA-binding protein [Chthoniobacterales bacterium]
MNSHSYERRQRHGRGRSRRRGGRGRFQDQRERQQAPKQKTFWQRIVAFFGGNGGGQRKPSAPQGRNGQQQHQPRPQEQREQREPRPQRKPESVEVTSPRLYVGNLSFDATESDLFELFNGVGHVQNAEVVTYRHNQRSKGFAFVSMQTVDEAKRAVEELHDKEFLGRKLVVSGAKSSDREHSRD